MLLDCQLNIKTNHLNQVFYDLKDGVSFAGCNLIIDMNTKKEIHKHPEKISFSYLLRSTIYHPSTFIKKQMFDKYGLYNEENKVVSDWEFFLKTIGLNGESFQKINKEDILPKPPESLKKLTLWDQQRRRTKKLF